MSVSIFCGRFAPLGTTVYFDAEYDLRGTMVRRSDDGKRVLVEWNDGAAVWYSSDAHSFYGEPRQ